MPRKNQKFNSAGKEKIMKKFNLNHVANMLIKTFLDDRKEYDIETEEAKIRLKKAVLEDNIDLNNETTSYDLEELMLEKYEDDYIELQKIIKEKVENMEINNKNLDWVY